MLPTSAVCRYWPPRAVASVRSEWAGPSIIISRLGNNAFRCLNDIVISPIEGPLEPLNMIVLWCTGDFKGPPWCRETPVSLTSFVRLLLFFQSGTILCIIHICVSFMDNVLKRSSTVIFSSYANVYNVQGKINNSDACLICSFINSVEIHTEKSNSQFL